jgi:hypothetical protein
LTCPFKKILQNNTKLAAIQMLCLQETGNLGILTLFLAAIKKCIEWRLQVQRAFSTEVDLAPSRPE